MDEGYSVRGTAMLYQKNVPVWERWVRIVIGVALVGYALFGAPSPWALGIVLISAVVLAVTNFVGYCPACAMLGRKPVKDTLQS